MWTRVTIAAVLAGCSGSSGGESGNPTPGSTPEPTASPYLGPTQIASIDPPGCDPSGDRWRYRLTTRGWTDEASLVNAWETGRTPGWNEEHDLSSVTFRPGNHGEDLALDLPPGADPAHLTRNYNTVFACGDHDEQPIMTYVFRVYDRSGTLADCAILSTHGAEGIELVMSGRAPAQNPVTRAAEINSERCAIWSP